MSETTVRYQVYTQSPFDGTDYEEPKLLVKITGNTGAIDAQLLIDSIQAQLDEAHQEPYEISEMPSETFNND